MNQTIVFNNQTYMFLDYITLGTSNYLFIFNSNTKDLKCLKDKSLEEYSINSSFLPCDLNKVEIINHFLKPMNSLIEASENVSPKALIRSIKRLAFYIRESDLRLYLSDKVPYQISSSSLSNLDLFINKTIEVSDKDKDDNFFIETVNVDQNQALRFNNQVYTTFYHLNINGNLYALAVEQNKSNFIVFSETADHKSFSIPTIDINNPSLDKCTIHSNILINYFVNVLNENSALNPIVDFNVVNKSIERFITYLKTTDIKKYLLDNSILFTSEDIVKYLIYLDYNVKTATETVVPLEGNEVQLQTPPIVKPESSYFQKEKKKKSFNTYTLILIASVLIIGVGVFMLIHWVFEGDKTDKINDNIKDKVDIEQSDGGEAVNPKDEAPESDYWRYMKMSLINVDFDELLAINPDTVGWIQVNGTNINYPVVQSGDNDYYLHHAFDGSYNNAGWIFADYRNDLDNLGKNNILYGHGRLDTTMFGSLKNILTSDWYNNSDNYVVKLSTPKQNTLWQVFSVYAIKSESYYITTEFPTTNQYKAFIKTIKGRSVFNFSANVDTNDKILTLSTCQDNYNNRVVMHAKLIKSENRN